MTSSQCSVVCSDFFPFLCQVKLFQCQPCQFHRCTELYLPHQTYYTRTRSIKVSMADHNEPSEVKMQIGIMREKLKEAMPVSVQEFPWKKAEQILLDRLLNLAQETVKWSLVLFFIFSSVSDVVYTFSINRELVIPIGLFVGLLVAGFLKEISQDLFHRPEVYFKFVVYFIHSSMLSWFVPMFIIIYNLLMKLLLLCPQEKDLKWHLLGMYCIFVFAKFMSTWFATLPRVFLLHVANGGLIQALWHSTNFMEDEKNKQETSSSSSLHASWWMYKLSIPAHLYEQIGL